MSWLYLTVGLVAVQRLAELVLSARNTRRLLADGAVEHGRRHYPIIVLLHASWLVALVIVVPADRAPIWPLLSLFVALQAGRVWVLATLGRLWTTRVITLPDAPLVTRGPYRWCRHPNYVIVAAEIALLPLAFGVWPVALVFSLLNAILLHHRIGVENQALAPRRGLTPPSREG